MLSVIILSVAFYLWLCWMSLWWMSLCWVSWHLFSHIIQLFVIKILILIKMILAQKTFPNRMSDQYYKAFYGGRLVSWVCFIKPQKNYFFPNFFLKFGIHKTFSISSQIIKEKISSKIISYLLRTFTITFLRKFWEYEPFYGLLWEPCHACYALMLNRAMRLIQAILLCHATSRGMGKLWTVRKSYWKGRFSTVHHLLIKVACFV